MKWEYMITTFPSSREWVSDELNHSANKNGSAVAVTSDGHTLMKRPKGTQSVSDPKRRLPGFKGAAISNPF